MKRLLIIFLVGIILMTSASCGTNPPEIYDDWLIGSAQVLEMNSEIKEAEVIVEDNKITFYMAPSEEQEVSIEKIRDLAQDFLIIFGGYSANDEIQGPNEDSYGEIYDYYDVEIIVEGYRTIIERGRKDKGTNEIVWEGQEV